MGTTTPMGTPPIEPISIEGLDVQALLVRILKMGGPVGGPSPLGLSSTKCRLGGPGPSTGPPILRMQTRRGPGPGPLGAQWKRALTLCVYTCWNISVRVAWRKSGGHPPCMVNKCSFLAVAYEVLNDLSFFCRLMC